MKNLPLVSVIIPVYNDAERLQTCLAKLALQTYSAYEVMVVDNGSRDLLTVQNIVAAYPFAQLLTESIPGSYAARNCGIAQAQGDILAFTDATVCRISIGLSRASSRLKPTLTAAW